jgi:hypothetical protein
MKIERQAENMSTTPGWMEMDSIHKEHRIKGVRKSITKDRIMWRYDE